MPKRIDRRTFIRGGVAAGAALTIPALPSQAFAAPRFSGYPFSLGVASGEPTASSVVLWTRLAPTPLIEGGGMDPVPVRVRWQVAHDERFRRIVRDGVATARPQLAHSVHVEPRGLQPRAHYFFRFLTGDAVSPTGRTQTLPAHEAQPAATTFAVACCQRFEHGYYTALRDIAGRDLDLVVHVGDYIYENVLAGGVRDAAVPAGLRAPAADLASYRLRHALYKTDPDLQAAHAAHPWSMILDNHDAVEDGHEDPATLNRRAAAYQAYYEHLPMRASSIPQGPRMRIRHRLAFGDLLQLHLLDTRQFKDDQAVCGPQSPPNNGPRCEAAEDEARTMLGDAQERWLLDGLERSGARWNAITQTILFAPFDFSPSPEDETYYLSGWDGYPAERRRLLDGIQDRGPGNPVLLSGDWHTAWVNDLHADPDDLDSDVIATEFVVGAVSSEPGFTDSRSAPAVAANPDVRAYDPRNGYTICRVGRDQWQTDLLVTDPRDLKSRCALATSWVLEDGRPQAERA